MNAHGSKWIRPVRRRAIYRRDGNACVYCRRPPPLTLDHLVPRALGGGNETENLVTCCRSCNRARSTLPLRAWFRVLRARGVVTRRMGARIRRLVRKSLRIEAFSHGVVR